MGEALDKLAGKVGATKKSKVERLVRLAYVHVPPHPRVVKGKTVMVKGYRRKIPAGGHIDTDIGGGDVVRTREGEGFGHLQKTTYAAKTVERHKAYQWKGVHGDKIHTGVFTGIKAADGTPIFKDDQGKEIRPPHPRLLDFFDSLEEIDRKEREKKKKPDLATEWFGYNPWMGK